MTDFSDFSNVFGRVFTTLARNILAKPKKTKPETTKIASSGRHLAQIVDSNTGQNVSGRRILSAKPSKSNRFSSSQSQLMADMARLLQQAAKRNL